MNKTILLLLLFSAGILIAQDKKDKPEEKKEAKDDHDKKSPMRYETGDIQVDPRDVAEGFRNSNLKNLRKLKVSAANVGDPERYKSLYIAYTDATTIFYERKFLDARRKFEENARAVKNECRTIGEKYKSRYSKLAAESSRLSVEKKVNFENEVLGKDFAPVLEKLVASAAEAGSIAEGLLTARNSCDAIYFYRFAINNFIMVQYNVNREKNRNLSSADKVSKNLLLDDDYIPAEYLKDYDDSMELISANRDKEREREREIVRKMISDRKGTPKDETKSKSEPGVEKKKDQKETKNEIQEEKAPKPADKK
ncbi:MAG: hypothetical protein K8R21_08745 [Leptospira sp.]|nr:hypothetical protein [Leptospira sp.]